MSRTEKGSRPASAMNVSAVRRHLRKRVVRARSGAVRLVRLTGGTAPPAEVSPERSPDPDR